MTNPTYHTYSGFGALLSDLNHYSQAVRLPTSPPIIKCSGQGGWNPDAEDFNEALTLPSTKELVRQQVSQAFANVELTLKTAGCRGWSDVYLVRAYMVSGSNELMEIMQATADALRRCCPEHRPVLTVVEVKALADPRMCVEVEVEALLSPESGAA